MWDFYIRPGVGGSCLEIKVETIVWNTEYKAKQRQNLKIKTHNFLEIEMAWAQQWCAKSKLWLAERKPWKHKHATIAACPKLVQHLSILTASLWHHHNRSAALFSLRLPDPSQSYQPSAFTSSCFIARNCTQVKVAVLQHASTQVKMKYLARWC